MIISITTVKSEMQISGKQMSSNHKEYSNKVIHLVFVNFW